ncbi:MAG: glucosamine-6-phosphate deaminase [Gemmatimonadetes bacterium]|nr:glucosamine-6-phosphate deaminase [Gemmatimonadota bacterium]MCB9504602.1 glucosamine-6-phosphate deaminase [Gemmatimonadales bacterium]HPF60678.1 glucosamine-6-phosphate deaminase [Gemmatimonadales bacterium]HRX19168.1 glucosamine-6-phosphate deaminase [Gemmatimonadales bacterium]
MMHHDLPATDPLRRLERLPVEILDPPDALARAVATRIADLIRARAAEGRPAVLGLATGSTPVGVYRELVRMHREEGLSFAGVETFNLDEYWPMDPESIHSYRRFMREHLFDLVDLDPARCHVPPGDIPRGEIAAACRGYEASIRAAGGIDIQLLGIGKTGHIGFNEPGSGVDSRTRLVTLDTVTRRDAAADFFGEQNVPRQAITMGVATILEAREILLLATGEHKAAILRRAIEGEIDHAVAATFLQRHPAVTVHADEAAAAELTRVATPWLLDEVAWTPELEVRAVVWLSLTTGRAILKLTEQDYVEHHLSPLLARHGAPGVINGLVFNALGSRIRGRSKLPKKKTVVCFSPHPDDDVISAGGILRKLHLNENRIVVAYMTSGNIAVFDHDVLRYVEILERLAADERLARRKVDSLAANVRAFLAAKRPGEVDSAEVQDLKRIIREGEAISGLETLGIPREGGRFLDLPFYQTGAVKKNPIGPDDVAVVRALLEEVRPDLVLVAGDLSDPHGTHRLCKDAIDAALAETYPEGSERPEVWLYRGAWQEWPVTEATWLVPLAQEELRLKIQAIFKHQSQKDSAPFPGQDDREFWQRVEHRNKETAAILDRLGLAEYFAMEAYVVAG